MKKLFFAITLAATITNFIQAQSANGRVANNENNEDTDSYKSFVTGVNGSPTGINNVNINAVRDFLNSCKKVENVHWYIEPNGSFVYYYLNGNKGRRFYDTKGNFIYNILSYSAQYLPDDIKDQVRSTYYFDYNITWAEEIQTDETKFYVVHLKNKTTSKNVRVCGGEINVLEEFENAEPVSGVAAH